MKRSCSPLLAATFLLCPWTVVENSAADPATLPADRKVVPLSDGDLAPEIVEGLLAEGWRLEQIRAGEAVFTRRPPARQALAGSGVQIEVLDDLGVVVLRGDRAKTERIASLLERLERSAPPSGGKLEALVRQRLETLGQLVDFAEASFAAGKATQEAVIEARDALTQAELESAAGRPARIAMLERHLEHMRRLEEIAELRRQAADGSVADALAAKAARLKAEIALERETRNR